MAQAGELVNSPFITSILSPNVSWFWDEGAELVTNGDDNIGTIAWTGDDPDDWTVVETGATADVTEDAEGIQLVAENGVQEASIYQDLSLDPTKRYYVKSFAETITAGSVAVFVGQDPTDAAAAGNMSHTHTAAGSLWNVGKPDQFANTGVSGVALESAASDGVLQTLSVREKLQSWYPNGRRVYSISFTPGSANDILVMRDGGMGLPGRDDGYYNDLDDSNSAVVWYKKIATDDLTETLKLYGQRYQLWFDHKNSTINAGARIIIRWAE